MDGLQGYLEGLLSLHGTFLTYAAAEDVVSPLNMLRPVFDADVFIVIAFFLVVPVFHGDRSNRTSGNARAALGAPSVRIIAGPAICRQPRLDHKGSQPDRDSFLRYEPIIQSEGTQARRISRMALRPLGAETDPVASLKS